MSQNIGVILLSLKADTSAFVKGLGDAKSFAFTSSDSIVQSLKSIGTQLGKLNFDNLKNSAKSFEMLGGVAAGVGVGIAAAAAAVAESTAEQAKQLSNLSQSYAVPIEQISAMRVASKLSGVDMETLGASMGRLAKSAAQVATTGTGPAADAFKTLGVNVTDSSGKLRPMSDLMADIADKFSKMGSSSTRTALAMDIFGRGGAAMIPLLAQGSDGLKEMQRISDSLGLTWSQRDVDAAKQFLEQIELLELNSTAFKENVAKGLIPALNDAATAFTMSDKSGGSLAKTIGTDLGEAVTFIAKTAISASSGFEQMWLRLKMIGEATATIAKNPLTGWAQLADTSNPIYKTLGELDDAQKKFEERMVQFNAGSNVNLPIPPATTAGVLQSTTQAQKFSEAMFAAAEAAKKLNDEFGGDFVAKSTAVYDQWLDKLNHLTPATDAQRSAVASLSAEFEKLKAQRIDKVWTDFLDSMNKASLRSPAIKSLQDQLNPGPVGASGEIQAGAQHLKLLTDINEQNRLRLQYYEATVMPSDRLRDQLRDIDALYADKNSKEYLLAVQKVTDEYKALYDPAVKYRQELRQIDDLLKNANLSETQHVALLQQKRDLMRQIAVADAQQKAQGGGAGSGIRAGLATFGAQWQGIGLESMKATMSVLQSMQNAFANFFTSIIEGTKTIGQAFAQLGIQILDSIIAALAQMLAQWIVTKIAMAIFGATTNVSQVASYAAVAGAAAYAATAAIPFIGPEIAPGVALASYMGAMAFAPLASAAGGMEVTADQLALVHKNEHIIPADIAQTYKSLARSGERGRGGVGLNQNLTINGATDADQVARKVMRLTTAHIGRMRKDFGY